MTETIREAELIRELQRVRDFLVGERSGATRQQVVEELENVLAEAQKADHDT